MKKRFLSILMALCMALSLLPATAFAREGDEETPVCVCEAACAADAMNAECPVCGAEDAAVEDCGQYGTYAEEAEAEPTPEPMAEPENTPEPEAVDDAVAAVQAMIDALPNADAITAENRAAVEVQLTAIDDARLALDDDAVLDYTRYQAAIAALETLDGTPGASEPETLDNVSNENGLISAIAAQSDVTLTGDIKLKDTNLTIQKAITIDLNGYTLTYAGSASPAISVQQGGTLTLSDSSNTGSGKLLLENTNTTENSAAGVYVASGGTFNMTGGTIQGGTTSAQYSAGGVYVASGGKFSMTAGTIQSCSAKPTDWSSWISQHYTAAGGVYVAGGGEFTMQNGKVYLCYFEIQQTDNSYSPWGGCAGGVVNDGTFTITGGTVSFSYVYVRKGASEKKYIYQRGLANNGTVHANKGQIDGIYNKGNVVCDDGYKGTTFTVTDATVQANGERVAEGSNLEGDNAKNYNGSSGTISGGVFRGAVYNIGGTISGGTFESAEGCTSYVENHGTITNGTFKGTVENGPGIYQISGGTFTGTVKNIDLGIVSGGTFTDATRDRVCEITFNLNGGTAADGTNAIATQWRFNAAIADPGTPTRKGYRFLGWYNGTTAWNVTDKVTSTADITLMANWQSLPQANVTAPTANTLTYNGSPQTLVTAGSSSNGTMMYSLSQNGTYTADIPTGEDAGQYTVWYYAKGDGENTIDSGKKSVSVTIAAKSVFVSGIKAQNKTYDGTTNATLDCGSATINDLVVGDAVSVTATGVFVDKNAGTGKAVTIQSITLTGEDASNYTLPSYGQQSSTSANISKKSVTAAVLVTPKDYDGTTTATVTAMVSPLALCSGDSITITGLTGQFNNADVGTNKPVTLDASNVRYSGTGVDNYEVTIPPSATGIIKAIPINATVTVAQGPYIYNGAEHKPSVTVTNGSETISESEYNVVYSDNLYAGTATVTVTSKEGSCYAVSGTANFTIAAKSVFVSGITAQNKTYDGTTNATLDCDSATINGLVTDDGVTVTATGAFEDKNAGNDKTVTIQSISLSGTDARNYTMAETGQQSTAKANILKRALTATLSAEDRTYNGTTDADVTVTFTGLVNNENLAEGEGYTVSAAFVNANAATGKTVTATVTLNNQNYTFTDVAGKDTNKETLTATANIAKKPVTAGITVAEKQYDGLAAATVTAAIKESDLCGTDSITIAGLTGQFNNADVGTNKPVTLDASNVRYGGTGVDNYEVTIPATAQGNIVNNWEPAKDTEYTASEMNANGWRKEDFTVTAKDGYELSLTDTADDTNWSSTLTASTESADGKLAFYVRNGSTGAISNLVTEGYKLDKNTDATGTSATVSFTVRDAWQTFVSSITFGLFYKDEVTVKATASDELSGVDKVEYAASDSALSLEQVKAITAWTAMPAAGVGVTVADAKRFVYFIRVTDNAGNISYFSTDGAEYDTAPPTVTGIENGATYCAERTVTVSDKHALSVTVNGSPVTPDAGSFTISPAEGTQTVVVTDVVGNKTEVTVTINNGHTLEWKDENGQYWQKCKFCDHETAKKDTPELTIHGADRVCETQDYRFTATVSEGLSGVSYGYEFASKSDGNVLNSQNGVYSATLPSELLDGEGSFTLLVEATTADGYTVKASKTVQILSEHTGGTATCTKKAECEVCGEEYGAVDADNHSALKHVKAKSATTKAEGNTEYWHCEDCGRYFSDQNAKNEIALADTVISKRDPNAGHKAPGTGDDSHLWLWLALALAGGGALVGVYGKKKKRVVK